VTTNTLTYCGLLEQAGPTAARPRLRSVWTRTVNLLVLWTQRSRFRTELMYLSPRQLDDMGLDPTAIEIEVRKPFWRA
jgi:uncharacterized protein YjiS (DUF1127 family)